MKNNIDIDIYDIKTENKIEDNKGNYKIIDKNIKESFRFEELLSEKELEKLKGII